MSLRLQQSSNLVLAFSAGTHGWNSGATPQGGDSVMVCIKTGTPLGRRVVGWVGRGGGGRTVELGVAQEGIGGAGGCGRPSPRDAELLAKKLPINSPTSAKQLCKI